MVRRGVTPIAELAGYGASSDAFHVTQPSPGGEGAARAIIKALEESGLTPSEIGYINAHGTSTPMNDKFETEAVKASFGDEAYKVKISSTKSLREQAEDAKKPIIGTRTMWMQHFSPNTLKG